jgi:hypothetical protein
MQSITYIHAPQQNERRISLSKLSVVLASFTLWAALIGSVALIVR